MLSAMRSWLVSIALVAVGAGCDGTDAADGARGSCASGGTLAGCADSATDPEAACWRLVECGSYPIDGVEPNDLDWGRCVDELNTMVPERATVVMACIASSTCDELQAPGSPTPWDRPACFDYGAR